jgi:hypothetical protein
MQKRPGHGRTPNLHLDRSFRKKYVYDVYRRHPKVPPHEAGNFIYAKIDAHKRGVPIYIGQGDLTQWAAMERDRA